MSVTGKCATLRHCLSLLSLLLSRNSNNDDVDDGKIPRVLKVHCAPTQDDRPTPEESQGGVMQCCRCFTSARQKLSLCLSLTQCGDIAPAVIPMSHNFSYSNLPWSPQRPQSLCFLIGGGSAPCLLAYRPACAVAPPRIAAFHMASPSTLCVMMIRLHAECKLFARGKSLPVVSPAKL